MQDSNQKKTQAKNQNSRQAKINLSNDILFLLVMQDPERCRKLLEMILGFKIKSVTVIAQQTIQVGFWQKGIRLDIVAIDTNGTRYDIEMQTTNNKYLGFRFRYYQGKIDFNILKRGEEYDHMPNSYIIFICTFDPFQKGQYRYTIKPHCEETNIKFEPGQTWIVLNTKGEKGNISQELKEFLAYVDNSCEENAKNEYLKDINGAVVRFLTSEWRDDIMTWEQKIKETHDGAFEEGRTEGRDEGSALKVIQQVCQKLIKGQNAATIADALEEDEAYIQKIMAAADKYAPDYDPEKIYVDMHLQDIQ